MSLRTVCLLAGGIELGMAIGMEPGYHIGRFLLTAAGVALIVLGLRTPAT